VACSLVVSVSPGSLLRESRAFTGSQSKQKRMTGRPSLDSWGLGVCWGLDSAISSKEGQDGFVVVFDVCHLFHLLEASCQGGGIFEDSGDMKLIEKI